jgi:hypothetical protein
MSPHESVVACSSFTRFIYVHTHTQMGDELKTALVDNREKRRPTSSRQPWVCVCGIAKPKLKFQYPSKLQ